MEAEVKLKGALPKGDANGLAPYASEFVRNGLQLRAAIILFNAPNMGVNREKEIQVAELVVRRVELVMDPADAEIMHHLVMRSVRRRSGESVLPLEFEQDIEAAFRDLPDLPDLMDDDAMISREDVEQSDPDDED